MIWAAIDRVARLQHALITSEQLLGLGVTPTWIREQLRAGRLDRMRLGVFRIAGSPVTREQAWLAAVLGARADAVLSHHSAAAAWVLKGFEVPEKIDLLSTTWRPRLPGVRGHLSQWLPPEDRTRCRRVPITSVSRTLIDASGGLHPWTLGRIVDDALRRKLIRLPDLVRCFHNVPPSGRRPSRAMRSALEERGAGFHPGGSVQELAILRILRRAGVRPLPVQQCRVVVEGHSYFLDFAWPDTKHAIEFDGGGGHDTVSDRHRDRDRWRRVQRAGWTLWSVTERTSHAELAAIGMTATAGFDAA